MAKTVARMTADHLRHVTETSVERKLLELFGDPDQGQRLKRSVRHRLLRRACR